MGDWISLTDSDKEMEHAGYLHFFHMIAMI